MSAAPKLEIVPSPLKLDFGCGPNKREGFLGVDRYAFDGKVDVVMDVCAKEPTDEPMYTARPGKGVTISNRVAGYVPGFKPWPWETSSVDEVWSSHFVEHLTQEERCHFFNELWRVLKPGAQATIVVPHWANARAYGDPTHKWPAISEWFFLYLNRPWREANAPHADKANWPPGYDCNFDGGAVTTVDPNHLELKGKHTDVQNYATRNFINVNVDAYATLTAKK